ncbi:hypothetical protein BH18ACT4_BH18ACT4_15530 [soil metagenome]
MTGPPTENRLRDALRAHADTVDPDETAGLDRIRHLTGRARSRRRFDAAGLGVAAVLVIALVVVPGLGDDGSLVETVPPADEQSTTSAPTITTVPDATTPSTVAADPSPPAGTIWPPAGHAQYDDPVDAARSFVDEYIGFARPTFGEFSEGEPGAGEIEVFSTGENGLPRAEDVASTISLRRFGGDFWGVTSAQGDEIVLESPDPGDTITSPVAVAGRGSGFEAAILVEVRDSGSQAGDHLARDVTMGGSGETLEPFAAEIEFSEPSSSSGSLLLVETTGLERALTDFTVIPVAFGPSTGATPGGDPSTGGGPGGDPSTAVTQFEVFLVTGDGEVEAVDRSVPQTTAVLRAALTALLPGPTDDEKAAGYTSVLPVEAAGQAFDVVVSDGDAVIDFAPGLLGAGGLASAQSEALLRQLHGTVFQFAAVTRAEYRLGGSCDDFWSALQRSCTVVDRDTTGL